MSLLFIAAVFGIFKPFIKGTKRWHYALAAASIFFVPIALTPSLTPAQKAAADTRAAAEKKEKDATDAKEALLKVAEFNRKSGAEAAKESIRNAARNPDSVSFSDILVNEDATLICVVYRAQNGFGGMNVEQIAFFHREPKQDATFWNKHCAHAELYAVE